MIFKTEISPPSLEIFAVGSIFYLAQADASFFRRAACFDLFASGLAGGLERVGQFASMLHSRRI